MARDKYIDTNPRFLAVDLTRPLLPGSFEQALHHRLDHAIDLSSFDARVRNDDTGATAYPPACRHLNAFSPVTACPMINECMSCVPSYV